MTNIIKMVKDWLALYKAIAELREILAVATPELKADVLKLAADIDGIVVKVQGTPNELDDKLIPILTTISAELKKLAS